jgi:(E)-4-hydroxy-3-methyl-but-2-enyl pyrophosphate reductase
MKKLIVAGNTGFCFGVKRTVQTAENLLKRYRFLYSIGDIVHNPLVMENLKSKGLRVVDSEEQVPEGPFIVRSHGLGAHTIERLKNRGVELYDATCPILKKIHSLLKKLDREKYLIIIIGNENHPEVMALKEYVSNLFVPSETAAFPVNKKCSKAVIVGQTTLSFRDYFKTARYIVDNTNFKKTVVYNTICRVTGQRQDESIGISRMADMVLVLGGKTSSNTTKLYQNCKRFNKNALHIERMDELEDISFTGIQSVGLTSGTSTPEDFILEVKKYMKKKGYMEVRYNDKWKCRETT